MKHVTVQFKLCLTILGLALWCNTPNAIANDYSFLDAVLPEFEVESKPITETLTLLFSRIQEAGDSEDFRGFISNIPESKELLVTLKLHDVPVAYIIDKLGIIMGAEAFIEDGIIVFRSYARINTQLLSFPITDALKNTLSLAEVSESAIKAAFENVGIEMGMSRVSITGKVVRIDMPAEEARLVEAVVELASRGVEIHPRQHR
jgi:hypothetical protein